MNGASEKVGRGAWILLRSSIIGRDIHRPDILFVSSEVCSPMAQYHPHPMNRLSAIA